MGGLWGRWGKELQKQTVFFLNNTFDAQSRVRKLFKTHECRVGAGWDLNAITYGELTLFIAEFDPMSTVSRTLCHAWRMFCVSSIFKECLTRDFRVQVFFMNQFPRAPEYPIGSIAIFYENSRRYSQLCVFAGVVEPMISLYFRISPRIFVKIRKGPYWILRGPVETDSRRKPEVENLISGSL